MSRIYFHSLHGEAEVAGAERHRLATIVEGAALGAIGLTSLYTDRDGWLFKATDGCTDPTLLATFLRHSERTMLCHPDGTKHLPWGVLLNTAVAIGSPVVQLAAKIHGYCEVHAYVESERRQWLAGLIERGLELHVLRETIQGHPLGWRSVVELLRSRNDGPVVMSYSVCESFPGWGNAGEPEEWENWSRTQRWEHAMGKLREKPYLALDETSLGMPCFSEGVTLFDLEAAWCA